MAQDVGPAGPYLSEGSERLAALREEAGWTQSKLAVELDTSEAQINRWLRGAHRPSRTTRRWIEMRLGIESAAWDRPAKSRAGSGEHALTLDINNLRTGS